MGSKHSKWHNLLMLFCLLPMAVLVYYLGKNGSLLTNDSGSTYFWLAMLLLCPAMHLFMMRGMHHHGLDHHAEHQTTDNNKEGGQN